MCFPHVVPERPGGVVVQQRVDHAVGRRHAQRHRHGPLQRLRDAAAPPVAHGVQVHRPAHVVGQEAEQEGCCHHGNQVHRAPPVAGAFFAGQVAAVGPGGGRQAADDAAVADDDGEERQEEAQHQTHVVQDEDAGPRGRVGRLEAAREPLPERRK